MVSRQPVHNGLEVASGRHVCVHMGSNHSWRQFN